jgi:hypothetical protein
MSKAMLWPVFLLILLAGCRSYQMEYGVVDRGSIFYPLCKRSKQRITDMQRISFELPLLFKQAPCRNWPDYSYDLRGDYLNVVIPESAVSESQMSVGGIYSMSIHSGPRKEYYLSPEMFFTDYQEYLSNRSVISQLVTASWVSWQGGRCARFYSEKNSGLFLRRVLDYFCWESVSGSNFPIHISASEKLPLGHTPVNLDKAMVEPVLASLQVNPVPAERLALWAADRSDFCTTLKRSYDDKTAVDLADSPDRRRTIRYLRECGYSIPDPAGVKSWADIFRPGGRLIGQAAGETTLRKVSRAQFTELQANLMALQPKKGERPEIRVQKLSRDGSVLVDKLRLTGPYPGQWYRVPPYYGERDGFGVRHDPVLGPVIDVYLRENALPLGLKIVGE